MLRRGLPTNQSCKAEIRASLPKQAAKKRKYMRWAGFPD